MESNSCRSVVLARLETICCSGNQTYSAQRLTNMTSLLRTFATLLVLGFAVSACGNDAVVATFEGGRGTDANPQTTIDGVWKLTGGIADGSSMTTVEDWPVTLTIEGSSVSGRAACNGYGGSLAVDGTSFLLTDISQTEMGCAPEPMEMEALFLAAFTRTDQATRQDDRLTLTGPGVTLEFELELPVPTADLLGTLWTLDTIIQGPTATSTHTTADPATLQLLPNGTFMGSTGCRTLTGEYTLSGATVQLSSFGADGECPADLQFQDNQVITVLGDGFTAEVGGGRLTLTATDGESLSYSSLEQE
jgi:heat shock protein HslJ